MTADHFIGIEKFEADLWKLADGLRANSNLGLQRIFHAHHGADFPAPRDHSFLRGPDRHRGGQGSRPHAGPAAGRSRLPAPAGTDASGSRAVRDAPEEAQGRQSRGRADGRDGGG